MSNALWKKSLQYLSKILVTSFSLSLVAGLLSPTIAVAIPMTNSFVESAPINLTGTPSTPFAGDSVTPTITVKRSTGVAFPQIPSGEYYYANLYNLDTGHYVSSDSISSVGSISLNFPNLIPVGINNYQIVLSHGTDLNRIDNINDLEDVIGKSAPFVYERNPIAIKLTTAESYFDEHGTTLNYEVNQEINDEAYAVQVFNKTTGKLEFSNTDRMNDMIGIKFPYGDANSYVAILAKQTLIDGNYQPSANLSEVTDSIAVSNTVSLQRKPWTVNIQADGWGVVTG